MHTAMIIVLALFAVLLAVSAGGKLARHEMQMATLRKVGFPEDKAWLLAACELAGAAGLVIGAVWWSPLAVAAAAGLILYFLGAAGSHLRKGDRAIGSAVMMSALAVVAMAIVTA